MAPKFPLELIDRLGVLIPPAQANPVQYLALSSAVACGTVRILIGLNSHDIRKQTTVAVLTV